MLVAFLMVLSVIPMSAFAGGVPVKGDQIAFWNFDENTLDEDGWTVVDADGDGKNWTRYYGGSSNSYSPSYVISSASWDSTALAPDNWAITPAVEIPEDGAYLTYYTKNQGASWAETYRVYVGSSNDIDSMEPITDDLTHYNQTAYEKQTLDLADYAGETIYIAFRHYNVSNMYRFYIDDVAVNAGEPEVEPTPQPTVEPTPEPELPTLDEAVNVEGGNIEFVTQGDYPWVAYFDNGIVAAKSSNQGQGSSTSVLTTTVEANAGDTLAFNFKAWGEGNSSFWDKCEFKVNGETKKEWGAYQNSEWELYEYTFEEDGEFTIEWSYTKDSYVNPSGDYFAIDDVEVIPTDSVEYIDIIEINDFVEPAWNEEPFYDVTVPEDAHYSIDYTDWKYRADEGFDSLMGEGDVFDNSECAYFQYFEIVPDEGYKFADEVTVLINGSESNVDYDSSLLDEDVYYVYSVEFFVESVTQTDEPVIPTEEPVVPTEEPVVPTEEPVVPTEEPVVPTEEPVVPTEEPVDCIDTIEINDFVVPEWGEAPFYNVTLPEDAHYYISYTDWNWYNHEEGEIMSEGDVFDREGVAYYQYFELLPEDGYHFADSVSVYINGGTEYIDFDGFDGECYFVVTTDFFVDPNGDEPEPTNVIDTIEINDFVVPEWGEEAFFDVTVPSDAHYSLDYTMWYYYNETDGASMNDGDVFNREDVAYYQWFQFIPEDGYEFASDVTILINGTEDYTDYNWCGVNEDGTYEVSTVDFFVEEPVEPTEEPVVPTEEPVVPTEEPVMPTEEPVMPTEEPVVPTEEPVIPTEEPVIPTEEPVVPTEEPVVPTEEPVVPTEEPVVPTEEPVEYIDTIEINGFVVPEWGANPFYGVTVPEDAHYTLEYTDWSWIMGYSEFGTVYEDDTFDNSERAYFQYFEIFPEEGYEFAENVTVLINGAEDYVNYDFSDLGPESCYIYTIDFFVEEPEVVTHWGDANGDGVVDSTDVLLLMRYVMGVDEIEEENLEWCDVNGDGSIDMSDALFVSRYVMGSIDVFPVEENE